MIVDSITKGKNKTTIKKQNNVLFIHFHLRTKEANYICTIKYDDKVDTFFFLLLSPSSPSFKYIIVDPHLTNEILF